MIAMLDTSENLDVCQKEIGCPVEQLFTPLTCFRNQFPERHFGVDNGCIQRFKENAFLALLEREKPRRHLCRFVCCPDVVVPVEKGKGFEGSAIRTLEVFERYRQRLCGWPVALVVQDGQEHLPIPWEEISAVFIGGSTKWKVSPAATAIVKAAKILGKWVHVGRINTPGRFEQFEALGADSMDGSGLARFSHMRKKIYDARCKTLMS